MKPRRRVKKRVLHYDFRDNDDRLVRRLLLRHIVYFDVKIGGGPALILTNGERLDLNDWDYARLRDAVGIPFDRDDPDN